MKKRVVVEFVSNVSEQKRKWYQAQKLIGGTELAERIQSVIDEYDHRGFRLLRTEQAFTDGSVKEGDGIGIQNSAIPTGLLLFFESYD